MNLILPNKAGVYVQYGLNLVVIFGAILLAFEIIRIKIHGYSPALAYYLHEAPFRGEEFSTNDWDNAFDCSSLTAEQCDSLYFSCSTRAPMVADILDFLLSENPKNINDVEGLIGFRTNPGSLRNENCDEYYLGFCSGLRWDLDVLYICYDEDGFVKTAGHAQH